MSIKPNAPTLYELAAIHPDGRRMLIAYTSRKGRRNLWGAITNDVRRDELVKFFGTTAFRFGKRVADGATWGGWAIRWTGRTQREAVQSGELEYIPDIVRQAVA